MKLYPVETGKFRLDGGAMFGVVPKPIWEKTNPADEKNRIDMAMRCLLIEDGKRLILVDNGLGHKYNTKFAGIYQVDHTQNLESSLNALGFSMEDITDVFLTHLHFDHCGGSTKWISGKETAEPAFPNARFLVQKKQLNWANFPNDREKASYFRENIQPLQDCGRLELTDGSFFLTPEIEVLVFDGHTDGQQLPLISYKNKKIFFAADLFPTWGHIPLPYVMGYDTRPLLTLEERKVFMKKALNEEIILFYEHDPYNECGTIVQNEKGGFQSGEVFRLSNLG